jgi:hypothetical protein
MWMSRDTIKANLIAEMKLRFPARGGNFPESLKISALGFPDTESLREWGKSLNRAVWFHGWFAPSEFLACVTLGRVEGSSKPNLIDLMFNTQTRPPEAAVAEVMVAAGVAKSQRRAVAKKAGGGRKRPVAKSGEGS